MSRTPESIEFGLAHTGSLQLVCTDLKDGRARVDLRLGNRVYGCSGVFEWWEDHAHFADDDHVYAADVYRSLVGKIVLELRRGGQRLGIWFLLF